jgi:hypothetical protein
MIYIVFQNSRLTKFALNLRLVEVARVGGVIVSFLSSITGPKVAQVSKQVSTGLSLIMKLHPYLGKLRSIRAGRANHLLALADVEASCIGLGYTCLGRQRVPLRQIRGTVSTGRCRDFDANFQPLDHRKQRRCQELALLRRQGVRLPPVLLIRVADVYFVQDGHHRISVAQALGEPEIEAVVTVWEVAGWLPWRGLTFPTAASPQD